MPGLLRPKIMGGYSRHGSNSKTWSIHHTGDDFRWEKSGGFKSTLCHGLPTLWKQAYGQNFGVCRRKARQQAGISPNNSTPYLLKYPLTLTTCPYLFVKYLHIDTGQIKNWKIPRKIPYLCKKCISVLKQKNGRFWKIQVLPKSLSGLTTVKMMIESFRSSDKTLGRFTSPNCNTSWSRMKKKSG